MTHQEKTLTKNEIKQILSLKTKTGREQEKEFFAEGIRICQTLIKSPLQLIQLYTTKEMLQDAENLAENITVVSKSIMERLSPSKTPSGLLGIFSIPKKIIPEEIKKGIVLARISDPGNAGALIRSAVAFGFSEIIMIEGCDPWNPKVIQASAGTIGHAKIYELSWSELKSHQNRPPLMALVPRDGNPLEKTTKNNLLIIGNEAHGIPHEWITECDSRATLSMPGKIESLNAAVAGSIALYLSISE